MAKTWLPKSIREDLDVKKQFGKSKTKRDYILSKNRPHIRRKYPHVCAECNRKFESMRKLQKFCSKTCCVNFHHKKKSKRDRLEKENAPDTMKYTHFLDMSKPMEEWEWEPKNAT